MNFLRKSLLAILILLLPFLLLATALDVGILREIGRPGPVKQTLSRSGIYKSIVPSLQKQARQIETSVGSISATDPAVTQAANQAAPPQYIEQKVSPAVDNIYAWLNGQTSKPNFRIDLSDAKSDFANNLADIAASRLGSLPTCTTLFTASSFDIVNSTCIPPGVSPQLVAKAINNAVEDRNGLLDSPVISSETLKNEDSGQSIFDDQLKSAPKNYQRVKKTPLILSVAALLAALLVVFLSATRRGGLRRVGVVLLFSAFAVFIAAWALNQAVEGRVISQVNFDNSVLEDKTKTLIKDLTRAIGHNWRLFALFYTITGVITIVGSTFIRPGSTLEPAAAINSKQAAAEDEPANKPEKSRKIKVN